MPTEGPKWGRLAGPPAGPVYAGAQTPRSSPPRGGGGGPVDRNRLVVIVTPPVEAVFPNQNIVGKIQAICVDECDNETVTISYSLGNDGTEDITDEVDFEIWGNVDGVDMVLWTSSWTAGLRAGMMEASTTVELVIPGTLRNLLIKVDGGSSTTASQVMECDETDNETTFGIGCI